jgi:hypothetical protein
MPCGRGLAVALNENRFEGMFGIFGLTNAASTECFQIDINRDISPGCFHSPEQARRILAIRGGAEYFPREKTQEKCPQIRGTGMNKRLAVAFIITAFYGMSTIAEADEGPQKLTKGGTCWVRGGVNNRTNPKLKCDGIGDVTVSELYQKGFRVVAVYTDQIDPPISVFIIEEQK